MHKILMFYCLLFSLSTPATAGDSIYFLNKSPRPIHLQKRTVLEVGSFPYVLDTLKTQYQSISIKFNSAAILGALSVPPKGPYGTADAWYYLLKPGDSIIITLDADQKPVFTHNSDSLRTAELQFFPRHLAYTGVSLPYQFGLFGKGALNQQIWSDDLRRRDKLLG